MLTLLDRHLIRSYVRSYLICLTSLMSLFVVVDLFNNLDEFTKSQGDFQHVVGLIFAYYRLKILVIFDRMAEGVVLLAAMFAVAWVQRNNELLPLLSAGVSTRRVVRPVLFSACVMMALNSVNQELMLPKIDVYQVENRSDPHGKKDAHVVSNAFDSKGVHLMAKGMNRQEKVVLRFTCVIPAKFGRDGIVDIQAKQAKYVPPTKDGESGGWLLTDAVPPELDNWNQPSILQSRGPGTYFLKTDVDFESLTRHKNWIEYMSTLQLIEELNNADASRLDKLAVTIHTRLTRPLLGVILVFLGLSVILRDQNRHVFISAGLCLALCALFYTAIIVCKYFGEEDILSPALAAWLPVFGFGPLSFVMFDAVHT